MPVRLLLRFKCLIDPAVVSPILADTCCLGTLLKVLVSLEFGLFRCFIDWIISRLAQGIRPVGLRSTDLAVLQIVIDVVVHGLQHQVEVMTATAFAFTWMFGLRPDAIVLIGTFDAIVILEDDQLIFDRVGNEAGLFVGEPRVDFGGRVVDVADSEISNV